MHKSFITASLVILLIIILSISFISRRLTKDTETRKIIPAPTIQVAKITVTSSAFKNNQIIPKKYTCDGRNINPPLKIVGVPENVQSLMLTIDDPDAQGKTFNHWIIWNILPEVTEIEENTVPKNAIQGKTDFGKNQYNGPCPPSGKPHRYKFKIYALDTILNLTNNTKRSDVEKTLQNHILGKGELVGLYGR